MNDELLTSIECEVLSLPGDSRETESVILVTGATGNVGRQVTPQLLDTGAAVRALTRNPDSAGLPGGVAIAEREPA